MNSRTNNAIMQPTNINVIAALIAATLAGNVSASDTDATSSAKRARFLVLDSRIIETTENAKLTLGKTVKSRHNPLMAEDKPWEKRFENLYANVIYDQEDKLYKCWYSPFIVDNSASGMTLQQRRETPRGFRRHPPRRRFPRNERASRRSPRSRRRPARLPR